MPDENLSTTHTTFRRWRAAEAAYIELIADLHASDDPPLVHRQLALDLAAARSRADLARNEFFKRALHG